VLACCAGPLDARISLRPRLHSRSLSNRHRLTVNTLITQPGTFEWEWYGVTQSERLTVPTVWKLTPGTAPGFWSRTELSASFDALAATDNGEQRILQASDHLSLAATTTLPSVAPLQLAFAPSATFLLRGDHGTRLGGLLLARIEDTRQQGGFTLGWSGATAPSTTNPAGTFDASTGYSIALGRAGLASRITPHGNILYERSSGLPVFVTISEGAEYQANASFSLDLTVQHLNLRSGASDTQVIAGITWNLGRVRHRRNATTRQSMFRQ
jgi:hypothetical protein